MKRGKKYIEAAKLIERGNLYDPAEAVALVKKSATAKFDETIEAHIRTGCDGRHADQQIRGAVVLPHGTGKKVRILVFAKDAKAEEAKAAPTEVASCTASGLWTTVLNFAFKDTAWMNAINSVTVNGTVYTNKTISSFGSDTNIWDIGSATGAYGSYTALRIVSPDTYPLTVDITAAGYQKLTMQVTKTTVSYQDVYTATIVPQQPVEKTYKATAAAATHGKVTLSKSEGIKEGETVTATATPDEGYELDTLTVAAADSKAVATQATKTGCTFAMPASDVTVTATFKEEAPKTIDLSQVSIATDTFGNDWEVTFKDANGYVKVITEVKVNGTTWEEKSYSISSGGAYKKHTDDNKLVFAAKDYSSAPVIPVLKSGDVITISAKGYEDFTAKLVIDLDGKASLVADDGKRDPYELHVKIEGTFDSALVGQDNYDAVSSASVGGASSNKNSDVTVYGAMLEKGKEPTDSDWKELDNMSQIKLDGKKCSVSIVPDTASGTPADSDSGMQGVYMTISSALTLSGTPKDAGNYLISVKITDQQGREAVSNTLPFHVYTGEETLADRLVTDNFKQYESGLYAWDIMEPWAIKNFGSNVDGETESVRVPKDLEAWFGSHVSGTYGYLGYDLPWKQVVSGDIPQTLYIPEGCNLTLTNMKILSSVRIVIENGGKLTLDDSVVQGIIDVQSGGTFSMNYSSYNNEFTTGASLCGQLRLADGAILENAAIYSHANYLANGNLTDRTTSEPVVTATGNVTIKGKVFIKGDDGGSDIGQMALRVSNGTLTLEDGAELVAYGGSGKTLLYTEGGTAIELDNATITGNGKVTAIGGDVLWGNGGTGVTGNGIISTKEAFLQGATANTSKKAVPGKATDGNVKVTSTSKHIEDGTEISGADNDPLADLYWKTGINPTPPLDKFVTTPALSISDVEVANTTYTGSALDLVVTAKDGETVLTEGTDYFLTFKDADGNEISADSIVQADTYTVVVNGVGSYGGIQEIQFTVEPKQTTLSVTTDPASATYDGTSKTPTVEVKDGDQTLVAGTDYKITYIYGEETSAKDFAGAEFVEAGSYKLVITGIGNYAGSTGETVFEIKKDSTGTDDTNKGDDKKDDTNKGNDNTSTTDKNDGNTTTDNNKTTGKDNQTVLKDDTTTSNTNNTNTTAKTSTRTNSVKTGDTNNLYIWITLLAVSCVALAGLVVYTRRRRAK